MKKKVLVAYASKQGATAEIAQKIGEIIKNHDHDVEVTPADTNLDPAHFDAMHQFFLIDI